MCRLVLSAAYLYDIGIHAKFNEIRSKENVRFYYLNHSIECMLFSVVHVPKFKSHPGMLGSCQLLGVRKWFSSGNPVSSTSYNWLVTT